MFLILGIFLISLASAENIGTFKIDEPFQITNYCNSGDCSYMNLTSITYPNGTVLYINEEMTKTGQEFNYSFISETEGEYNFKTCANPNSDITCESDIFIITKTGKILETKESLVYFILAFGVLLLFALSFYFMISTPYGNETNEKGAVIKITKLKYVKLALILLTWVLFTWFLNILIGLSDNFVSLTMYYGFFGFMFDVMNRLALPLGIVIFVIAIFEIVRDANIMGNIKKFGSAYK